MGGADLAEMLLELYRINHKSTKYYTRIVYWAIGTAVVNSWLIYRRNIKAVTPEIKPMSLIKFQTCVAKGLIHCKKTKHGIRKRGRPSLNPQDSSPKGSPVPSTSRYKVTPEPDNNIRLDGAGHWVTWEGRGRCRKCKSHFPCSKCRKCKVYLCCNATRNCFLAYHT